MSYNCAQVVAANSSTLSGASALIPNATSWTLAFWYKSDINANYSPLFNKGVGGADFTFELESSGNIIFYNGSGGGTTVATISTGVWHHFVLVSNPANNPSYNIYVDGSLVTSINSSGPNTARLFELGYDDSYGGVRYASGRFCEAAIWQGTALTGTQVTDLYNLGVTGYPIDYYSDIPPTTYWNFNALVGGQFADSYATYPLTASNVNVLADSVVTHGGTLNGRVRAVDSGTLTIFYNEAYDPTTGLNPANYTISSGTITGVVAGVNNKEVVITVSGLVPGHTYNITPTGVLGVDGQTWNIGALSFTVKFSYSGFVRDSRTAALWRMVERKLSSDGAIDYGLGGFDLTSVGAPPNRRGTTGVAAFIGQGGATDLLQINPVPSSLLTTLEGECAVSIEVTPQSFSTAAGYGVLFAVTNSAALGPMSVYFLNGSGTTLGQLVVQYATSVSTYVTENFTYCLPLFSPEVITIVRRLDPFNIGQYQLELYVGKDPTPVQILNNLAPAYSGWTSSNLALGIGNWPSTYTAGTAPATAYIGEVLVWNLAPTGAQIAAQTSKVVPGNGWLKSAPPLPVYYNSGICLPFTSDAPDSPAGSAVLWYGAPPDSAENNREPTQGGTGYNGMTVVGTNTNWTVVTSTFGGLGGRRGNGGAVYYYNNSRVWNGILGVSHTIDMAIRFPVGTPGGETIMVFQNNPTDNQIYSFFVDTSGNFNVSCSSWPGSHTVTALNVFNTSGMPNLIHVKCIYDAIAQTMSIYTQDIDTNFGTIPTLAVTGTGLGVPYDVRAINGIIGSGNGQQATSIAIGFIGGGGQVEELYAPTIRVGQFLDAYGGSSGSSVSTAPSGGSVVATYQTLTIPIINGPIALGGNSAVPGDWLIKGSDNSVVAVTAVNISGTNLVLTTGDMKIGLTYTLTVPSGIIGSSSGLFYTGPYTYTYTGASLAPTVSGLLASPDDQTLQVTFNKPMNQATALNINNYAISGGVQVIGVTPIGPAIFKLKTLGEQPGVTYTLTPSSNIQDLVGNSLT
jgi:hypothetical protein